VQHASAKTGEELYKQEAGPACYAGQGLAGGGGVLGLAETGQAEWSFRIL